MLGSHAGRHATFPYWSLVASQREPFPICGRVDLGVPIAKQWRSEAVFYPRDVALLLLPVQSSEGLLIGSLVTFLSLQRRSIRARLIEIVTPEGTTDAYVYLGHAITDMCKRNVMWQLLGVKGLLTAHPKNRYQTGLKTIHYCRRAAAT